MRGISLQWILVAALAGSLPASAQIVGGVVNPPPVDLGAALAQAQAAFPAIFTAALTPEGIRPSLKIMSAPFPEGQEDSAVTDFDNVPAPPDFPDTKPLQGEHQHARFFGFNGNGGAILNQDSNFGGLLAYSQPNFLAFNSEVFYLGHLSGKKPILPELIVVGENKSSVSFWVSGAPNPGYPVGVIALGPGGVKDATLTTLTDNWSQVTVSGSGIGGILLVGTPLTMIVDNITVE